MEKNDNRQSAGGSCRLVNSLLFREGKFWNKTFRSFCGLVYYKRAVGGNDDLKKILAGKIPESWQDWITIFPGKRGELVISVIFFENYEWRKRKFCLSERPGDYFPGKKIRVAYRRREIKRWWRYFCILSNRAEIAN